MNSLMSGWQSLFAGPCHPRRDNEGLDSTRSRYCSLSAATAAEGNIPVLCKTAVPGVRPAAGACGNDADAPKAVVSMSRSQSRGSTLTCHSCRFLVVEIRRILARIGADRQRRADGGSDGSTGVADNHVRLVGGRDPGWWDARGRGAASQMVEWHRGAEIKGAGQRDRLPPPYLQR